jgi:hypothetical protein
MSRNLSIGNHEELHAAVVRAAIAGGAYGLLHWRWPGPGAQVLGVVAIGLAAVPPRTWRSAAVAAAVAVLAGAASALGGVTGAVCLAALGGVTFARGVKGGGRAAVAAGAGALALAAAWFVERAFTGSEILAALPQGLTAVGAGAAAGFVAGMGVIGRELGFADEAAATAAAATAPVNVPPTTELGGLLERAQVAFGEARGALGDGAPEACSAAEDLLGRIVRFGKHWHDLEVEAGRTDRAALSVRLDQIVAREEAAKDDVVRAEYAHARGALREQLDYLDGIERGRDRAVARLHHHIAVLERLRLAALHHRSADATRVGEELAPLVEDLTAAGRDLDYAVEALAELPATAA